MLTGTQVTFLLNCLRLLGWAICYFAIFYFAFIYFLVFILLLISTYLY